MQLTECIVTKIAHDVAGCSGAILNTSELLTIDPNISEVSSLLFESADTLIVRMKFFRCIFGTHTDVPKDIGDRYLKTLSQKFKLAGYPETNLQLAFVLFSSECLMKGGDIGIKGDHVSIEGDVSKAVELVGILNGQKVEVTPHNVIAFWILKLVQDLDKKINIIAVAGSIRISII